MRNYLVRLFKEEDGQALTEYGLLIGLIALAVIGAVIAFGGQIKSLFAEITEKLVIPEDN